MSAFGPTPSRAGPAVRRAAVALLALMTAAAGAEHRQTVGASGAIPPGGLRFDTGHRGAVTHLAPWRGGDLLISAGADGTLRVWDPRDGALRHSLTLAGGVPSALVVHPRLPRAYLALGGADGERVAGWDWERDHALFSVPQDDRTLFLGLSRTARSLLVGRAAFDGLWLLDPATGDRQAGLERSTGIVTFAVSSRDEQTVLTYQPSGSLTYRSRATGQIRQSLRVPADLTGLGLSADRRYLIGRAGEWLVSVDAVDGAAIDRRRIDGLRLMALWGAAGRLLAIAEDEHGPALHVLPVTAGRFEDAVLTRRVTGVPTALSYGREAVFLGLADGTILALDLRASDPAFAVLARDERLAIIDVAVTGSTIALGTEAGVVTVAGDFVLGAPLWLAAGERIDIDAHVFPRPFGPDADRRARVTALDADRVLVWSAAEEPGIAVLHLREDRLDPPQRALAAPLANLDVAGGTIAAVDRRGQAALLAVRAGALADPQDTGSAAPVSGVLEPLFTARIPGAADVVAGERNGAPVLIVAVSGFGASGASIVTVAAATGETVAMPDRRSFVYDLEYDARSAALYSLGVHEGAGSRTTLTRHAGPGLEQRRTLFVVGGEDLRGSVAVEAAGGPVFFSLAGQVRTWDGRRVRALQATGRAARRVTVHRGRVYAANADGTLSVWSADTLAHHLDLRVWRDFEWLVTSPDRYWTSAGGARYVRNDPLVRQRPEWPSPPATGADGPGAAGTEGGSATPRPLHADMTRTARTGG